MTLSSSRLLSNLQDRLMSDAAHQNNIGVGVGGKHKAAAAVAAAKVNANISAAA